MGIICCSQQEENLIFPLENNISEPMSTLLIRNFDVIQINTKIKSLMIDNQNKEKIIEEFEKIFLDVSEKNQYIDFQKKFFEKFIEKIGEFTPENISIFAFPISYPISLMDDQEKRTPENFFNLLKEKFGNEFDLEKLEKLLITYIGF